MEVMAPWRIAVQVIVVSSAMLIAAVRPLPFLRVVALCMGCMIVYGMVQDQFSARLCPEYFTVAHPPIVGLEDATLLGIAWGFLGSWWGGMFLGLFLAVTARAGSWPRCSARDLIWPVLAILPVVALATLIAGVSGWYNADATNMSLGEPWASSVPTERHLAFFTVATAHFGTYLGALVGGGALCLWVVWTRYRRRDSNT